MRLPPADITPEGWTILRFDLDGDIFYKIFACWRDSDRWRLSSGGKLDSLLKDANAYTWTQDSGSVYILHADRENGYTYYQSAVLDEIFSTSAAKDVTVTRVSMESLVNDTSID